MAPTVTLRVNGLIAKVKWKVIGLMTFFPITSQDHLYGVSKYIKKNCFSEDLFSVTIKVHDCTLINLALNKKVYSIVSFFSFQNKWYISYLCWHCKRHL